MLREMPLFPLSAVLLPHGRMRLQIFEQRYLDLVRDCMKTQRGFGLVWIRSGREVAGSGRPAHELAEIGCLATIVDADQLPNGMLGITVQGSTRFRVNTTRVAESGLVIGSVSELPEPEHASLDARWQRLSALYKHLHSYPEVRELGLGSGGDESAWAMAYGLAQLLPLPQQEKYALLMADHAEDLREKLELLVIRPSPTTH